MISSTIDRQFAICKKHSSGEQTQKPFCVSSTDPFGSGPPHTWHTNSLDGRRSLLTCHNDVKRTGEPPWPEHFFKRKARHGRKQRPRTRNPDEAARPPAYGQPVFKRRYVTQNGRHDAIVCCFSRTPPILTQNFDNVRIFLVVLNVTTQKPSSRLSYIAIVRTLSQFHARYRCLRDQSARPMRESRQLTKCHFGWEARGQRPILLDAVRRLPRNSHRPLQQPLFARLQHGVHGVVDTELLVGCVGMALHGGDSQTRLLGYLGSAQTTRQQSQHARLLAG